MTNEAGTKTPGFGEDITYLSPSKQQEIPLMKNTRHLRFSQLMIILIICFSGHANHGN
jgi:hypothetical protein